MSKGTILIIDNIPDTVAALETLLKLEGYEVWTAKGRADALQIVSDKLIHLAVVDLRLERENDPEDLSGLHFAAELNEEIPKIILTAHRDSPPEAILGALSPDERGKALAFDFVFKQRGPDELLDVVQKAFQNKVHYNPFLRITFEKGLSYRTLVEMLKGYKDGLEEEKKKAEAIVEDLIRRLFDKAQAIHLLRIDPGRGGCGVVVVQPTFDGPGAEVVIKFGPRTSINCEFSNYHEYVLDYAPERSTHIKGDPVRVKQLAAIKYGFVRDSSLRLRDFQRYYQGGDIEIQTIYAVLDDLFEESCGKWYEGKRPPWHEDEQKPIDVWYREQLNLDDKHVRELWGVFDRLLDVKNQFSRHFQRQGKKHLGVTLERDSKVLPNPIYWALEERDSQKGSDFFPIPPLLAITHGDLSASNILVDKDSKTWLIDFFRTGYGPVLRDIAELESVIKFELVRAESLLARYELERGLLAPRSFSDSLSFENRSHIPELDKAVKTIQRLREWARLLADTDDMFEYYAGLLFYALKEIVGFSPQNGEVNCCSISQYHALLSAAIICDKLLGFPPEKKGVIFLAHEYQEPWWNRIYGELRAFIAAQGYEVRHPKDEAPGGVLWSRIAQMIANSSLSLYEITTMNGNVCFELGYAMGTKKPFFALVNTDYVKRQQVPPILQGEWWVTYQTDQELQEKVGRILSQERRVEPWHFFEQETFKARIQGVKSRRGSALLAVANIPHQRGDIYPVLEGVLCETCGWRVEPLYLEQQTDIGALYLQIVEHELIVGSLSSHEAKDAPYANAELALALGIACGAQKKVIILQEQGCKVLADMRILTREFRAKSGAAKVLQEELKRKFPRRCK
jgi:CheY-like chemotaxis protein